MSIKNPTTFLIAVAMLLLLGIGTGLYALIKATEPVAHVAETVNTATVATEELAEEYKEQLGEFKVLAKEDLKGVTCTDERIAASKMVARICKDLEGQAGGRN